LRFDLIDLALFLGVLEAGSITGGAARAHLALASASARLRQLEESLGVPLLTRGRRGVQPTAAGRSLAHHAGLVLQQVERMRVELGEYAQGLKGHVRLLCNTSALTELMPQALSDFMAGHPQVEIELEEHTSMEIVAAVGAGSAEVGIVADSAELGSLQIRPFRDDRLVLVTAPGHPLAARRSVRFAQALEHEFIGLAKGSALHEHLSAQAAHVGGRMQVRVRLRNFTAVCGMVERKLGVAVIPETAYLRCAATMDLRRIRLSDAWAARRLVLCMRRFDELPFYARQLVEHLQAWGQAPVQTLKTPSNGARRRKKPK
jgi:DNA-binding transcriptional LysR family regulator